MAREKRWGIYKILNKINGKFYIGSSRNIDKRLNDHKNLLRKEKHENKHLQSAWNKYGEENFIFEILLIIEDDNLKTNKYLRDLETEYILKHNVANDKYGYNIVNGGRGSLNIPCSEEKKQKISESNKGKIAWNKNIPMAEEQKIYLRKIKTEKYGKAIDIYDVYGNFIETINSVREVSRRYKCGRNTFQDCLQGKTLPKKYIFVLHGEPLDMTKIGNNRQLETSKHREQRMKEYRAKRGKKIDVYYFNGDFIKTYESISAVSEDLKVSESTVRGCIHKTTFNSKYIFKEHGDKTPIILETSQNGWYGDVVYKIYQNLECIAQFRNKYEVEKYLLDIIIKKNRSKINRELIKLKPFKQFIIEDFCIKLEPALCIGDNIEAQP